MTIELNTLSPKKWLGNYSNAAPTLDADSGIRVGDFAIDTSVSPNKQWICKSNTSGTPIWTSFLVDKTVSVSTTYSVLPNDKIILANSSSGAFSVNLPAVSSSSGVELYIKKVDTSANTITVDGNLSELIDGELTQVLSGHGTCIAVVCDGSGWNII